VDRARRRVCERFDLEAQAAAVEALLARLLGAPAA